MNILTLDRAELPAAALTALAPATKLHWSAKSALLGRITDENAYGDYATAEAWAKDKLDMTGGEYRLSMKLWRIILRCQPAVDFERWATVSKGRALLLDELLAVGAEPAEWFAKMEAADSTADFEMVVRQRLNEQVWTNLRLRLPLEVAGLVEEALARAIPSVLDRLEIKDDSPHEVLAQNPKYRHLAVEAIAVQFLETAGASHGREG